MIYRGLLILLTVLFLAGCTRDPAAREAKFLQRGKELMQKHDYTHAVVEFTNAVAAMPNDAEAHYQLGLAQLEAKRIPQAARSFQQATRLNPKHAAAAIKWAELMVGSQNDKTLEEAARRMATVLTDAPDNPDAMRALAIAEFKLGKGEEAEQRLTDTLERFPSNLKAAAALASMKLRDRDLAGAESVLRNVVKELPNSVEAGLAMAQFYVLAGKIAEAEAETARVLRLDANSAPGLLFAAALAMERGKTGEAEKLYRKIASLPDGAYSHAHAGFLLSQRRFDEAIAEYRTLSEASRGNRDARTRLIQALLTAGRIDEAKRDLETALKKNDKDQDALLQRSRILLAEGNFDAAEKDFRTILQFSPNSPDAHYGLARIAAVAGNDVRAREELQEALRTRPDLLPVRVELARQLIAARAAQSALDTMEGAPEYQRKLPEFILSRNLALMALNRLQEARAGLEAAQQRRDDPRYRFQRAVLNLTEKRYAEAKTDADALLKANPGNVRLLQLAVEARLGLQQRDQAMQVLRDAAAALPKDPDVQTMAGDAFAGLGKEAEARRSYEAALAARPSHTPAAIALARIDQRAGRTEQARQRLTALVNAAPRQPAALMTLADLEYSAGNRAAAAELYRRSMEADRRNVVALNNYAYLRAETDPEAALPLAQKALELAPDSATILDTLGWIYYRKGLHDLAVAHLQKAMAKEPTPRRQFHLGMAQMKLGQKQAAAENLSAALKKAPNLTTTESGW